MGAATELSNLYNFQRTMYPSPTSAPHTVSNGTLTLQEIILIKSIIINKLTITIHIYIFVYKYSVHTGADLGGGGGWGVRTPPLNYKSVGLFLSWVSSFGQQPLL